MFMQIMGSAPFPVGPYTCPEYPGGNKNGFSNVTGRTAVATYQSSVSTLVLLILGQSNAISIATGTSFVPTVGTDNFNFYDGKTYQAKDPLLGAERAGGNVVNTDGSSWGTRLASKMVDADMADRVIVVNMAVGGTEIANWAPGGMLGDRARFVLRQMQQAGIRPNFILQMQGESDAQLATPAATYAATCRAVVAEMRRQGSSAPYFVSQTTLIAGATTDARNAVRQGQVDACADPLGIFLGPDTDLLTAAGSYRQGDGTHLNVAGIEACAVQWLATLQTWTAAHP